MDALGWQDLSVALAVVGALAWLVRRWWTRRHRPVACEECPACDPSASRQRPKGLSGPPGKVIPESELKRR